jgi:branched-chain amino acid transport system substrate-binding protein
MRKIKIGISISLSGRYSVQGKESFEGLTLWVNEVNGSGGVFVKEEGKGLPVELIYYDDGSSADRCEEAVKRLIVDDKVDILIGPYSSGLTLSVAPIAESYRKTIWNHGGASDEVFGKGFECMISTISPASGYFVGIIEMLRKIDKGATKLALFMAEDSGFSKSVAEGARRCGEENGFQVTEFRYPSGTKDFSRLLNKAKEYRPDVILGVGRSEDDLFLAKGIIEQRIKAKAIGLVLSGIKEFWKNLGKEAEGFLGASQWECGARIQPDFGPDPRSFFDRFKDTYGKEPDYTAAQGYNIGLVIQRCIEESGTLNEIALREAAAKADFKTFYGHFKVDPKTGKQTGHRMMTVQWQNGNKVILYPEDIAQAKPIYPGPYFA